LCIGASAHRQCFSRFPGVAFGRDHERGPVLWRKGGPRRWLAIAVGFVGVLIIVRPGMEGFNAYSIYVLACVAFCAIRDLATRRIATEIPSTFISLLTAAAVTICGGLLIPFSGGWTPLTPALLVFWSQPLSCAGRLSIHYPVDAHRRHLICSAVPIQPCCGRLRPVTWSLTMFPTCQCSSVRWLWLHPASIRFIASGSRQVKPVTETTGPSTAVDGL
jgi:hypothetical protein